MKRTSTTPRKSRHSRVRAKIHGSAARPRISVFRSSKHIWVQLIDDVSGKTLAAVHDPKKETGKKSERARAVGKRIAEKASSLGITAVVFDRGGYRYHGRVKALAEGAREGGLKF